MIDFNRWIYSKDIAAWHAQNVLFSLEEQMDYICSAPHRTLDEKFPSEINSFLSIHPDGFGDTEYPNLSFCLI